MNEIDEIKLIENEAFLDSAILQVQTSMMEMAALRHKIEESYTDAQVKLGELLAHKVLFRTMRK
jgi:hypothetical protein